MGRLKISFDLDGTCLDITDQVNVLLLNRTGVDMSGLTQFDRSKEYGVSDEVIWECFKQVYMDWTNHRVMPGVSQLINMLHAKTGEPVKFITARPEEYAAQTVFGIRLFYKGPFVLAMPKSSMDKEMYLTDYPYYVDDRRAAALELCKNRVVFVPKQTYNILRNPPSGYVRLLGQGLTDLIPIADLFIAD